LLDTARLQGKNQFVSDFLEMSLRSAIFSQFISGLYSYAWNFLMTKQRNINTYSLIFLQNIVAAWPKKWFLKFT